ncbi:MAG TPA: TIGR02757 family protein [Synergistales bacterium]|nr:TIGR02757 family protein [Synergistales bacterium]
MKDAATRATPERLAFLAERFEELYRRYNRPEFVDPDPVSVVRGFTDPLDREVAGVIASSLAYGRASQIVISARRVLDKMRDSPRDFLLGSNDRAIREVCEGFRHRFTDSRDLSDLLFSVRKALREWGSLENLFASGIHCSAEKALGGLTSLSGALRSSSAGRNNTLLPDLALGSACKRYHLFLKWMVRRDSIDPGGWQCIAPEDLMIPLDTHMQRICSGLGLMVRKNADRQAVIEVTRTFRAIRPQDPTRYDFTLTRFGIRGDLEMKDLLDPLR